MSNAYDHENTIYGSYGEFDPQDTSKWTDEDWAAYDRHVGQDIADWEAQTAADFEVMMDMDDTPPF